MKARKLVLFDYVCIILCLLSVALLVFRYQFPLLRFFRSLHDSFESAKIWLNFCFADLLEQFDIYINAKPTILEPIEGDWKNSLSFDFDELYRKLTSFGAGLINEENFYAYLNRLASFLLNMSRYVLLLLPVFLLLPMAVEAYLYGENKRTEEDKSIPVKYLEKAVAKGIRPALRWLLSLKSFLFEKVENEKGKKRRLPYIYILGIVWAINLNIATLFFEFLAYYFYFVCVMMVSTISMIGNDFAFILTKFMVDVMIMFSGAPRIFWIAVFWYLFDYYRRWVGYNNLRHEEAKNCGMVKSLPVLNLIVGAPGTRKTTLLTDITLSCVNVFREEALDILFKWDLAFPFFPVAKLEAALVEQIEDHGVYTIPHVRKWVDQLRENGETFGYEFEDFGEEFSNGLIVVSFYEAVRNYCEAFFVYTTAQYVLSNYSIRTDNICKNEQNAFPLWDMDFFQRDPRKLREEGKFSHILDQDILRLGKRILENNPNAGAFGFGIYVHTEWGKSYPNQHGTEGIKKDALEANQKNDGYDWALKMARHNNSLIDNHVFVKFFADEQRPTDVPARHRDMVSVISILKAPAFEMELPHFILEDMLYDFFYEPIKKTYYKIRNKRKDDFLPKVLLRLFISGLDKYYRYYYNVFSSSDMQLLLEDGTSYGEGGRGSVVAPNIVHYKLLSKKTYSWRFASDTHADVFSKAQLECEVGINDLPCYADLRKSTKEMEMAHDYFDMQLFEMFGKQEKEEDTETKKEEDPEELDYYELDEDDEPVIYAIDDLEALERPEAEEDPSAEDEFDMFDIDF